MKPKPLSTRSVRIVPFIGPSPISLSSSVLICPHRSGRRRSLHRLDSSLDNVTGGSIFVFFEEGRDGFLARVEPPRHGRSRHIVALAKDRRQLDNRKFVSDRIFVQFVFF